MQHLLIAIDGPVGAGKSTIADALAMRLGILHLDTGAMYRALGLAALSEGIDPLDTAAAEALAERKSVRVTLKNGGQCTFLDDVDVTNQIRTPDISAAASAISKAVGVRRRMVLLQQATARTAPMVLDGRDAGTRILPDAPYKFFLTAAPEVRALRRFQDLQRVGAADTYEQVFSALLFRDKQDSERSVDPLRPAEDAITVDTSYMTFDEVVETLHARIMQQEGDL